MATRAVHFYVEQSFEANVFLQADRRFCSRRNVKPNGVYSDNGGNFVAAENELQSGIQDWHNKVLYDALLQEGATWHFNPPRSSHQGGFYERMFKTVRKLIRSLVAEATLDEFDLLTLVAKIKRIINDRPNTGLPSSPDDAATISPSMIISGNVCDSLPPDTFVKADGYRHSRKKTQFLADVFWENGFLSICLHCNVEKKWFGASPNVQVGDIVLLVEECPKRGQWPKAVILETMPYKTNLVRRVRVRTTDGGLLMRDILKICVLEGKMD